MKRLLLLVLLSGFQFVLFTGCQLSSADKTNLNEAKALLDAMRARQSYVRATEQFSAFSASNTVSSQEFQDRIYNEMARIYSEVYTETELRNIRKFFESPAGQVFLDKKPNPLQFLSESQLASVDKTNLDEAEALFNAMRVRQSIMQVAQQSSADSDASTPKISQDFYNNLYRGMVRTYAKVYSVTELRKMREFFESPAGQAFLDKKSLLLNKYQEVMQKILAEIRMK